ncbi:MAG: Ni/Fe-hydrogenase, b-type cytochrome subunit [Ignavibacteriales bacterium CG_4_9_14_3_um_filter_30_11]|nr:MAG: Ni/Fe-hydrogenase, b-type cytochrome subunit [Ignavibacteriales bacterium CG_4_9_14_3_um_filter_30_11]
MEKAISKKVYVWQMPVRLYHWVNALVVVTLAVTGYLIGKPPALTSGSEASFGYWFGTVRFVHFVAAFVFFFNFLFRIYWGFVGNKHADWKNFIPYKKEQWKEIFQVLKIDILQVSNVKLKSVGHNSMAGFTYFLTFLAFLFQSITGFGMYSAMSDAFLPNLFSWIVPLMGGDFAVRQWHHVMMWFFVIFAIIHVYLVFYHDYVEGRGTISSMAGGWKFIEKE